VRPDGSSISYREGKSRSFSREADHVCVRGRGASAAALRCWMVALRSLLVLLERTKAERQITVRKRGARPAWRGEPGWS
jgi:hypothetical protein